MTQFETETHWVGNQLNVAFNFGDTVRLRSGDRIGETGRIVALIELTPFPYYVIELPDGTNANAIEPEIEQAQ